LRSRFRAKLATVDEFRPICLFRVIGFVLEVFKIHRHPPYCRRYQI
jgi:uncharacterized membrane protein YoaT (DUF817 family)